MDLVFTPPAHPAERFDPLSALPFSEKSTSEETRRAYRRVVREFLRQAQMMSGHRDHKTVMRYDHGQKNLEMNAIHFISNEEE